MTFVQTIESHEDGHGAQRAVFALSDTYEGLFASAATACDVFVYESVKKDFNIEESSFAVDSFTFGINQAACDSEANARALWFALGCADSKVNRFCAMFMAELVDGVWTERVVANIDFVGRLENKLDGTDLVHDNDEWATMLGVLRDYKFSALSFDVTTLELAQFTAKINDDFNNVVPNVYDRLRANDWAAVKPLFAHRVMGHLGVHQTEPTYKPWYNYTAPLGNQYSVLRAYLDSTQDIINALTGTNVTFNLVESDLGFATDPIVLEEFIRWGSLSYYYLYSGSFTPERRPLRLAPAEASGYYTPWIHSRMVSAELKTGYDAENPNPEGDAHGKTLTYEKTYNNTAELLFGLAKFYGCYIRFRYVGTSSVDIQFVSRKSISTESEVVSVRAATAAKLSSENKENKDSQFYYATPDDLAPEGIQGIFLYKHVKHDERSADYAQFLEYVKSEKEKNVAYERLIHSIGATVVHGQLSIEEKERLLGQVRDGVVRTEPLQVFDRTNYVELCPDSIQTGIYVRCVNPKTDALEPSDVWRPAARIYVRIDGADQIFERAADYINAITQHDKTFYSSTYEWEVPFWDGFRNSEGVASWRNVALGARVLLSEPWTRYNATTGVWESGTVAREWTVVGIERNYAAPATKVKLQNISRFAFGDWAGNPEDIPGYETPTGGGSGAGGSSETTTFRLADDAPSLAINAVYKLTDGTVAPASPISTQPEPFGIAVTTGAGASAVEVVEGGRVMVPAGTFTNPAVSQVFLRLNSDPTKPNISDAILTAPTAQEDTIVILGRKDSADSFTIEIDSFIL